MSEILKKYDSSFLNEDIQQKVAVIANNSHQYGNLENLKKIFSLIDLTSLNTDDNIENIKSLALKVNEFNSHYSDMPNVAAICIYPSMVSCIKENLSLEKLGIASVGAGFPSSQTFLNIKVAECKQIIDAGATEVDMVLSVGKFFEGDYGFCYNEIKDIKSAIGNNHLKVILESGMLKSYQQIFEASILAMEAGADFIKTSTGKQNPAATTDAVYVMTKAIKAFYDVTGRKVGIKPAGDISTKENALAYFAIVKENLGDEWINPELFRIGASRLANNLLSDIYQKNIKYF